MKNLKKPTSAMLIAVMLITNSNGILAYANEQANQNDLESTQNLNATTTSTIQEASETEENEIIWTEVSTDEELNKALKDENVKYIKILKDIKTPFTFSRFSGHKIIDGNNNKIETIDTIYTLFQCENNTTIELRNIEIITTSVLSSNVDNLILSNARISIDNENATGSIVNYCNKLEVYNSVLNYNSNYMLYNAKDVIFENTEINTKKIYNYAITANNATISNVRLNGSGMLLLAIESAKISNVITDNRFNNNPAFLVSSNCEFMIDGKYSGNNFIAEKHISLESKEGLDLTQVDLLDGLYVEEKNNDTSINYYLKNEESDTILDIKNDVILSAVQQALGKKEDEPITKFDAEKINGLEIWGEQLSNIEDLKYFPNIIHLDLEFNNIEDISVLENLVNLRNLDLSYNKISKIDSLSYLKDLEKLDLTENYITDITSIMSLSNLSTLDLSSNNIVDMTILDNDKFANLDILNIYGQQIYLDEIKSNGNYAKSINPIKNVINGEVIVPKSISNDGIYDKERNVVEWDNIVEDTIVTYSFDYEKNNKIYSATVTQPIKYVEGTDVVPPTPNPPVDGGEDKPQPPIIDGIEAIEGVIVSEGDGTENSPKVLEIKNITALDTFIKELDSIFTYKIIGKPRIEGNYKIYKVRVDKKQRMVSLARTIDESTYIEIKVDLNNKEMVEKLDKKLEVENSTPQPPTTNPLPPVIGDNSGNNNYVPPVVGGESTQKPQQKPENKPESKPEENTKPQIVVELTDIKNHWAENNIIDFASKGYISGYEDKSFKPNDSMTRAEFIKLINKAFNFTEKGTQNFSDVSESNWFYNDILIAMKAGYIKGYEDNTFRPNEKITRQEASMIINNIKKLSDSNFDKLEKFADKNSVSAWAKEAVEVMIEKNYLSGYEDNTIKPKGNITRAEAVSLVSRIK